MTDKENINKARNYFLITWLLAGLISFGSAWASGFTDTLNYWYAWAAIIYMIASVISLIVGSFLHISNYIDP